MKHEWLYCNLHKLYLTFDNEGYVSNLRARVCGEGRLGLGSCCGLEGDQLVRAVGHRAQSPGSCSRSVEMRNFVNKMLLSQPT